MKKIIWILLMGMCLNSSWAQESQQADILTDETPIQATTQPLESHPRKFADLAKSTMELMSPEIETTQIDEQKTKHLQN